MKQNAANVNAMLLCQEQTTIITFISRVASLASMCRLQRVKNCKWHHQLIDFVWHVSFVSFHSIYIHTCVKMASGLLHHLGRINTINVSYCLELSQTEPVNSRILITSVYSFMCYFAKLDHIIHCKTKNQTHTRARAENKWRISVDSFLFI